MLTLERINLIVSLANNMVKSNMVYAEVHPKMQDNGQFPRDFERPRRVEEFLIMEGGSCHAGYSFTCLPFLFTPPSFRQRPALTPISPRTGVTIDRLLHSYNLPRDSNIRRPGCLLSGSLLSGDRLGDRLGERLGDRYGLGGLGREAKLLILFEYLGVDLGGDRLNLGLGGSFGGRLDSGFGRRGFHT
jgi:hypothetical protein